MPATTPNRLYPYPVPTDPVDVPGDIQRLAEAIDLDLYNLSTTLGPRPAAQLSSNTPFTATTTTTIPNDHAPLPLDTVEFNTGIQATITTANSATATLAPIPVVRFEQAGLYLVIAIADIPANDGTTREERTIEVRQGFGFPIQYGSRGRNSQSRTTQPTDITRTMSVSTMIRVRLQDDLSTRVIYPAFRVRTDAGGTDSIVVGRRTLTIVRMSPTP